MLKYYEQIISYTKLHVIENMKKRICSGELAFSFGLISVELI